jgi:hypothetical protein
VGRNRWQYFTTAGHVDLGDEGRIPPDLSGVGRKLTRRGLEQVLQGDGDVRPHLLARMPIFGNDRVHHLPGDLAAADRLADKAPDSARETGPRDSEIEAGRQLLNVGCIQCHPLHEERLPGVVGIDLAAAPQRLEFEWFRSFLLQPSLEKPGTRMPSFFPDGRSNSPEILHGDVTRQIASMWEYLRTTPPPPLPDRLQQERLHNYELVPADRPIILRSFAPGGGTHGIAVGFPQRVSLIFDAQTLRPAAAWRGRFVDARGAWFDRFAPPLEPLDKPLIELPAAPSLAHLPDAQAAWPTFEPSEKQSVWRGYRLDEQRVPTFLYTVGPWTIEDRLLPNDEHTGLERTIRLDTRGDRNSNSASWWFLIHAGRELRPVEDNGMVDSQGLRVSWKGAIDRAAIVRDSGGSRQWLVPLRSVPQQTFELEYSW